MAQEEYSQKCSNSSSGGGGGVGGGGGCGDGGGGGGFRSSKKLKQKKVPQRGLGVAQLEKIRLGEQKKKDSAILSSNSIISPKSSSNLAFQCPKFGNNIDPSSIPFPSSDVSSSIPLPSPNSVSGQFNLPKLWNCEYNLERENHRFDIHNGFVFRSSMNLPYESWTPPNLMNKAQQPCSSSMVNVSSGTSFSSLINYPIEPPSNQSYYSNYYIPMWTEEEKVVGMKRSYPFSLDNPPSTTSFHCKFPPNYFPPITRSDESASCGNGGTVNIEPNHLSSREGPSSSSAMSKPNSKKVVTENGGWNGDFLTLAPPTTTTLHPSSKFKYPSAYELPEFDSLPYQGSVEEPVHRHGPNSSIQQQLLYSFFPSAKQQTGEASTTIRNCNGEVGEDLDLNLKL